MNKPLTLCILALATAGMVGCAEDAGVRGEQDRYTVPESNAYAAPAMNGEATGITGEPSGAGGIDLSSTARPGVWDATHNAKIEQPAAAPSPYQNLPAGTVPEPTGAAASPNAAGTAPRTTATPATVTPRATTPTTAPPPQQPAGNAAPPANIAPSTANPSGQ